MMNDIRIHDKLSDLLYRDMLGMTSKEEKSELEKLLDDFHLKGLEREKIIARLEEKDIFDGRYAFKSFQQRKLNKKRPWIWWYGVAASIVVCLIVGLWLNKLPEEQLVGKTPESERITPGHSHAVVILANGQQVALEEKVCKIEEVDGTMLHAGAGELVYKTSDEHEEAVTMYNTIMIPRGGEYRLELSDGTKVWLNAETELRFPLKFFAGSREVYLKGEAYFEVKKDESHPFLVHVSMGKIKVLGTSFNVRDYKDENEVVTTLESGKVVYVSEDSKEEVMLLPGYQSADKKDNPVKIKKVDPTQYVGWREGKYVFEDVELEDIMRTLGRWYDIDVEYLNPTVKNLHFTGDLERYESIHVFLNFIETGGDVKFKTVGKTIIIDKK